MIKWAVEMLTENGIDNLQRVPTDTLTYQTCSRKFNQQRLADYQEKKIREQCHADLEPGAGWGVITCGQIRGNLTLGTWGVMT